MIDADFKSHLNFDLLLASINRLFQVANIEYAFFRNFEFARDGFFSWAVSWACSIGSTRSTILGSKPSELGDKLTCSLVASLSDSLNL